MFVQAAVVFKVVAKATYVLANLGLVFQYLLNLARGHAVALPVLTGTPLLVPQLHGRRHRRVNDFRLIYYNRLSGSAARACG